MTKIVQGSQQSMGQGTFITTANANDTVLGTPVTIRPGTAWKVQSLDWDLQANGGAERCDFVVERIPASAIPEIVARVRAVGPGPGVKDTVQGVGIGTIFRCADSGNETVRLRVINRNSTTGSLPAAAFATIEQVIPDPALTPWTSGNVGA